MGRPPKQIDRQNVLGANLKAEYLRAGLKRNAVAKLAGVHVDVLRSAENNGTIPSAERLDLIAGVLGRTSGQLLGTEPLVDLGKPTLARLPPKLVQDQTELQLLRFWEELDGPGKRMVLNVVKGLVFGDADRP